MTGLERVGAAAAFENLESEEAEQVARGLEIDSRYAGYIQRQSREIERSRRQAHTRLPCDMDYETVRGLSNEVREKLLRIKPATIGQAGRISGITPAAVSLLLIHLKKLKDRKSA